MGIRRKRIYEQPTPEDGRRILIDRFSSKEGHLNNAVALREYLLRVS